MKLNNKRMIEQTMNMSVKGVEVLYWKLEDAVYKNDSTQRMLLEFLLYAAKYKPALIKDGLQEPHRERMKVLAHEILENRSIQKKEAISIKAPIKSKKLPFKLEVELKKYLVQNKDILSRALDDPIKITGVEVEADAEGEYRCDIVAESPSTFYPIELKIAQGTHAVVSQCSKYCYYFYRQLRYDRFKKVQGVVIARGFDAWSVNELRRAGHWIFNLLPSGKSDIILEKIH